MDIKKQLQVFLTLRVKKIGFRKPTTVVFPFVQSTIYCYNSSKEKKEQHLPKYAAYSYHSL